MTEMVRDTSRRLAPAELAVAPGHLRRSRAEEDLRTEHRLTVQDTADADLGQRRVEQIGPVAR